MIVQNDKYLVDKQDTVCYNTTRCFRNTLEKEETNITFVKFQEHTRRRFLAIPPRFWAFWLMLVCLILPLLFVTRSMNIVHVSDSDGASRLVITRNTEPDVLMELAGIRAEEGDRVYYTAYNGDLAALSIQRAFEVTVTADGEALPVRMTEGTVESALAQAGVVLGEHDYTEPGLATALSEGDTVTVHRVVYQDTVEYEAIPYETEYVTTSLFFRRRSRTMTLQQGREGEKAITSRERWVDGELESSQVVDVAVTREPRNTVIKSYGAGVPVSSRTGPDGTTNPPSSYRAVYTGRATGYSASRGRGASGLGLGYGTVAVDPNKIPYGTLLYIASTDGRFVYGYAIATDTGTSLQNGTALVDLFYGTHEEALLNGVIEVNVYVVG